MCHRLPGHLPFSFQLHFGIKCRTGNGQEEKTNLESRWGSLVESPKMMFSSENLAYFLNIFFKKISEQSANYRAFGEANSLARH